MATALQLHTLRIKLNDYVDKTGQVLPDTLWAFTDVELDALIDDALKEVVEVGVTITPQGESWAMLIARADGLLMLAQDEARRIKWSINNKVIAEETVAPTLIKIAQELRLRYENARKREQQDKITPASDSRPVSRIMNFNDSVRPHANRNFNNSDVRRNTPKGW